MRRPLTGEHWSRQNASKNAVRVVNVQVSFDARLPTTPNHLCCSMGSAMIEHIVDFDRFESPLI